MTSRIAIIPARKGSKGIRNKNFKNFYKGASLVDIAIEFCENLNIDRTYVSTDNEQFSSAHSDIMVHWRDAEYASDTSTDLDVLKCLHSDNIVKDEDVLIWIRPTSPLRSPLECDLALQKMQHGFSSIRAIKEVSMHPYWMKRIEGEELVSFTTEGDDISYPKRQMLPPVFEISSEFEIISVGSAINQNTFFPKQRSFYITKKFPKVDIDTPKEFEIAKLMYENFEE